jgi:hypothetical protein
MGPRVVIASGAKQSSSVARPASSQCILRKYLLALIGDSMQTLSRRLPLLPMVVEFDIASTGRWGTHGRYRAERAKVAV